MSDRWGYRGYVTHREFGGLRLPVTIQNRLLRDYAAHEGLRIKLTVPEYHFRDCFMQLRGICATDLARCEGLIMCSFRMLPGDAEERELVYEAILRSRSTMHFVMENRVVRDRRDLEELELLLRMRSALDACPKAIPLELLPPLGARG